MRYMAAATAVTMTFDASIHIADSDMYACEVRSRSEKALTLSMRRQISQSLHICHDIPPGRMQSRSIENTCGAKIRGVMLLLLASAVLSGLPATAGSQSLPGSVDSSAPVVSTTSGQIDLTYVRPTEKTKVINYVFDAFGPYPIAGAAITAGVSQASNALPEWNQGVEGYAKRFGSDYGIAAMGTTTRYALSAAFKEDSMYYRCECRGIFPRMSHAVASTLTARRGDDGHRVFSFPALVAPYAGSMTAVYAWYPGRYGAKDAFRMGNYNLLISAGGNISLEFLYSWPHSLLHRMHLNNSHGAPEPGSNH
jgi:hypothetical protein